MSQDAAFYRIGLIESIILLLLLLLAFGALTVMMRQRWLTLGATESLLARLAASALVAAVAVGGLSGVVLNLLQGSAFSDTTLSAPASRNQAIVGIIRIEIYHRHLLSPPVPEEDEEWRVEPRR